MAKKCICGNDIRWGDECPECKAKDRETDMAVGDQGR